MVTNPDTQLSPKRGNKKFLSLGLLLVATFLAAALLIPGAAGAKEYSMGPVNIVGTVQPDSTFSVVEDRTFTFSGDYSFVYWEIPTDKIESLNILGISEIDNGKKIPYTLNASSDAVDTRIPGNYYVVDQGSSTRIYAFFNKSDESATFELTYTMVGAVKRYQDTSEVYWQAIGPGWEATTKDINVKVVLPVKDGETIVAGDNVRAWAHGPLNGYVAVGKDGIITLTVPRVDSGTFVEARVLFPQEWLPGATTTNQARKDTVLAEEKANADAANAARARAKLLVGFFSIGVPILALLALLLAIYMYFKWGKEYEPDFKEKYFRDVPADLHPAAAGALMSWGTVETEYFIATIMNLCADGVITMESTMTEESGFFGSREKEDYLLRLDYAKAQAIRDRIDLTAVKFLFVTIGNNDDTLLFSDIKKFAKAKPQEFLDGFNDWKAEVKAVPAGKGFFESSGSVAMVCGFLLGFATIGFTIFGLMVTGASTQTVIGAVFAFLFGAAILVISAFMRRRSREAQNLEARYIALKNYLKDFSKLNEAPPMHVILWEKYLVMAVVFGISAEVIKQMKVTMPELVNEPAFMPVYFWMLPHGSMGSPFETFSGTVVSSASVAASATSSAGGGGGGFSGGGGGGFGGGGGGAG